MTGSTSTTKRAPGRPDNDQASFEAWLGRVTERTDPAMAWLGVVFALLVGFQLAVEVRPPVGTALDVAGWLIWAVFVADFLAKFIVAPTKIRFLRGHWLQVLGLLLPTLRLFSFLRLVRLGRALPAARVLTTSYRSIGTARRLLRSRLAYLAGLATIATIALAELIYVLEHRPGGTIPAFTDALIWAAGVVVGMQANPVPTSRPGQLVMLAGFGVGLVVIATLAGSLGAFLLGDRGGRQPAGHDTGE